MARDFPAIDLKTFSDDLKANTGKVNQAHAGVESVTFTTCLLLSAPLNIKPTAVADRGTGSALNDLMGGQVDYMCDQIVNLMERIRGGAIKALAIAITERSPVLPDVPRRTKPACPIIRSAPGTPRSHPRAWPRRSRPN